MDASHDATGDDYINHPTGRAQEGLLLETQIEVLRSVSDHSADGKGTQDHRARL
jgi:hypothetical protein